MSRSCSPVFWLASRAAIDAATVCELAIVLSQGPRSLGLADRQIMLDDLPAGLRLQAA
ncbi:MAG TPA: hypothetical protein VN157_07310 [Caulobacter sp.]|nr:hypothetical protein [Caulobacter sp.]